MIHFSCILEDCILSATYRRVENNLDFSDVVDIQVMDNLSGEKGNATWTKEQWQAVMMLIADGDDCIIGQDNVKYLYSIAELAIKMLPASCRPIP